MHIVKVNRIPGRKGFMMDMTFEELRKLNYGEGEKILPLKELIKFY